MKKIEVLKNHQFWSVLVSSILLISLFFNMTSSPDIILHQAENPEYEGTELIRQNFILSIRQPDSKILEVYAGVGLNQCDDSNSNSKKFTFEITKNYNQNFFKIELPFNSNHSLMMRSKDSKGNYSNCYPVFQMSAFLFRAKDQTTEAEGLTIATNDINGKINNSISSRNPNEYAQGFVTGFPETTIKVRPRYYTRIENNDVARIAFFPDQNCSEKDKLGDELYAVARDFGIQLNLKDLADKNVTIYAKLSYKPNGVIQTIHKSRCYIFARNINNKITPPSGILKNDNADTVLVHLPVTPKDINKIQIRKSCEVNSANYEIPYNSLQSIEGNFKQALLKKWEAFKSDKLFYQLIAHNGRSSQCTKLVEYTRGATSAEQSRKRTQVLPIFQKGKFSGLKILYPALNELDQIQKDPMHIWVKKKEESSFKDEPNIIIPSDQGHEWIHKEAKQGIHYEYLLLRGRQINVVGTLGPNDKRLSQQITSGGYLLPWEEYKGTFLIVVEDLLMKNQDTKFIEELDNYLALLNNEGWKTKVITGKRHLDTDYTQSRLDVWSKKLTNEKFWSENIEKQMLNNKAVIELKNEIFKIYKSTQGQLKAVLLLGHLPIPFSGTNTIDGHWDHAGAWPADSFYTTLTNDWDDGYYDDRKNGGKDPEGKEYRVRFENHNQANDGKFNNDDIPEESLFQIGRLDFSNLDIGLETNKKARAQCINSEKFDDCVFSIETQLRFKETTLLNLQDFKTSGFYPAYLKYLEQYRRYFLKNIAYRKGEINPGNRIVQSTSHGWGAPMNGGRGLFESIDLVSPGNISHISLPIEEFGVPAKLKESPAIFVHSRGYSHYTKNGGAINCQQALFPEPKSMRAVFWGMFGSYFGDTYFDSNVLRSVLTSPNSDPASYGSWGLASYYHHRPIMSRMNLGGTIGESIQLGLNTNYFLENVKDIPGNIVSPNLVSHTLQGDPTLRMYVVPSPTNVIWNVESDDRTIEIKWNERQSANVSSYEIYWASNEYGAKKLIGTQNSNYKNDSPYKTLKWNDKTSFNKGSRNNFYWVRPVTIQNTSAGSFINKGPYTRASSK